MLKCEPSPLRLPMLYSGSSPALPFTYLLSAQGRSIFGKYLNAHLKFTVYDRKQTSTLQTHFHNAVPLVWGSLRLAPITNLTRNANSYLTPTPTFPDKNPIYFDYMFQAHVFETVKGISHIIDPLIPDASMKHV